MLAPRMLPPPYPPRTLLLPLPTLPPPPPLPAVAPPLRTLVPLLPPLPPEAVLIAPPLETPPLPPAPMWPPPGLAKERGDECECDTAAGGDERGGDTVPPPLPM